MDGAVEPKFLSAIDRRPIGAFQAYIFSICALGLLLDGFDVQAIGFVAPKIIEEWAASPARLGTIFSAGFVGMAAGAIVLSAIADKIGRRPVLIAATALSGLGMIATSMTTSMDQLMVVRLMTGVGLGGLMPNIIALCSEYTPSRFRAAAVIIMAALFSAGGAFGGIGAKIVLAAFDWRALFLIGGGFPLVLALAMLVSLPESLEFLSLKRGRRDAQDKLLGRLYPNIEPSETDIPPAPVKIAKAPFIQLFTQGRALGTALIWIVILINIMELYSLSNWLPTVMKLAGLSIDTAVTATTLLQIGGVAGSLLFAFAVRRVSLPVILLCCFVIGTCAISMIGWSIETRSGFMMAIVTVAGFCVVGGQSAVNALTAGFYPTQIRATGVGWALGFGRIGSIIGPLLGGLMIALKWKPPALFLAAAFPTAIAALCMVLFMNRNRRIGGPTSSRD